MGRRARDETVMLDNMMFVLMRKHNFNQTKCVKQFKAQAREKGIKISERGCYRRYDKVAAQIDITQGFQQNVNQFFMDLTKVASKATNNYLKADEKSNSYALDDYLRVAELQKDALNLQQGKSGSENNLFMQFIQQNNTSSNEVNVGDVLANIQDGLGEFGPLLQKLASPKEITGGTTVDVVHAESETKDPMRKRKR